MYTIGIHNQLLPLLNASCQLCIVMQLPSSHVPPVLLQFQGTWPVAIRQEYRLAEQLAESKELKHLLEDEPQVPSGFHAVLKLAWGVMLHIVGADNNQTHG